MEKYRGCDGKPDGSRKKLVGPSIPITRIKQTPAYTEAYSRRSSVFIESREFGDRLTHANPVVLRVSWTRITAVRRGRSLRSNEVAKQRERLEERSTLARPLAGSTPDVCGAGEEFALGHLGT